MQNGMTNEWQTSCERLDDGSAVSRQSGDECQKCDGDVNFDSEFTPSQHAFDLRSLTKGDKLRLTDVRCPTHQTVVIDFNKSTQPQFHDNGQLRVAQAAISGSRSRRGRGREDGFAKTSWLWAIVHGDEYDTACPLN